MKTLNITLTIVADTYEAADLYGKCALMDFAKMVGMRSCSTVASCEGDTKYIAGRNYEVNAKMQIDGNDNVNEVIQDARQCWNGKHYIISSYVFVPEAQKSEPVQRPRDYEPVACEECGQIMVKGYENVVKLGTDEEHYLCERCYTDAVNSNEVIGCEHCENSIYTECLALNPVTGDHDLCPVCGNKAI